MPNPAACPDARDASSRVLLVQSRAACCERWAKKIRWFPQSLLATMS